MGMEMSVSALGGSRNPWQRVVVLLVADVPIYLVTAALLAFCLPLLAAYDISVGPSSMLTNVRLYGAAIAGLFVVDLSWRLMRHRPRSPTAFLFDLGVFAVVVGATMLILGALAHQSLRGQRLLEGARATMEHTH